MFETPRAAADRDAVSPRKAAFTPRRPGKEKGSFEKNAPPGPFPPHAASRTLFRTKKSVRSDAHYVGRTGLRFSRVVFPGLNQKASKAGRRSGRFRPARRTMQAEPDAALPPRSAPRSEHAARCECSVFETPRAAADGDAATPRKTSHPRAARRKGRAALIQMLRPAPHRPEKKQNPNKNLPRAGKSTPRNVPRGTFRRPAILQKQCSTWNILSKIYSAPPRNSHYI